VSIDIVVSGTSVTQADILEGAEAIRIRTGANTVVGTKIVGSTSTTIRYVLTFDDPADAAAALALVNTPAFFATFNAATGLTVTAVTATPVSPPPVTGPTAPAAPPTIAFTTLIDILLAGVTQAQFTTADRTTVTNTLAVCARVANDKVRVVNQREIVTSKKFTTAATNLLITVETVSPSRAEADLVLQRVRDCIRNNGNKVGPFVVLSVNLTSASPTAAMMSRPVLALLALAAVLATLVF